MTASVLILHVPGTNRDGDMAEACAMAGGRVTTKTLSDIVQNPPQILSYDFLIFPGGFSFGDDLGAGRVWADVLGKELAEPLAQFIESGRPVLGVCNGFQALLKAGLILPKASESAACQATLTDNQGSRFVCRWVHLIPEESSACVFTRHLTAPIDCPVAHGEGRVVLADPSQLRALEDAGHIAFRYAEQNENGQSRRDANPNGSIGDIAGLCNAQGNVMGMMPHPENHIYAWQQPNRGSRPWMSGLPLFEAAIRYAKTL